MNPGVSVVIPTYNRAPLLKQAIESVLTQTYAPYEIIVVDDGSTDDTETVVSNFGSGVKYIPQTNRGVAAARNTGIESAQCEYIAFLDDDDLWVSQSLEWHVQRLQDATLPPTDLVIGLTQTVGLDDGQPIHVPWAALIFGSTVVRWTLFQRIGLLDEDLRYAEDLDWFLRVREHGVSLMFLDRVTLLYRMHPRSLMENEQQAKAYRLRAIQKSLKRRRAADTGIAPPLAEIENLQEIRSQMNEAKQ